MATAYWLRGRVLRKGGQVAPALDLYEKAEKLFEVLGERGERMASVTLAEHAACLMDLGRLDEAVEAYNENIKRA